MEIIVEGDVHGVSFRKYVRDHALHLGLKGYVQNIDDMVVAVAEGTEEKINQLIALCKKGPAHAQVRNVNVTIFPSKKEFFDFSIAY